MFKNYLDVALRSFLGNKLFSFINVVGLGVGLASVILIGLYVVDELSYDRHHPDADRLYRVSRDFYIGNGSGELLVFIGSGLVALCIAWVTVGGTAAKAAMQKPVLALRYE